jgi:hypothetical protein
MNIRSMVVHACDPSSQEDSKLKASQGNEQFQDGLGHIGKHCQKTKPNNKGAFIF